ncbi:MAG: hypothetical protein HKN29_13615, partial [Rhodothermales bacterium]|nr:hypothetical protein [Rhodothermales bacterium]
DLWSFANASNDGARDVGVFATQTRRFGGFGGPGGFGQQGQANTSRGGGGQRPATTVNRSDLPYFSKVSELYKEATGLSSVAPIRKPEGALFQYGYYQFGVPSFSTPGWAPVAEADSSAASGDGEGAARGGRARMARGGGSSVDASLLKWMDAHGIDGFVNWAEHDHPELGTVEIGGFKPYHAVNPPMSVVEELGPKHGAFITEITGLFADVNIAEAMVTDEGGGIFRITAEVENSGFLPTSTAHGVRSRSVRPTMVQLGIDPEDLLSGSAKTSFFQATDGSGRRQSFEWIIRGSRGDSIDLRVVSQKGGSDTRTLRLQ